DFHVTGVQTCALPISAREPRVPGRPVRKTGAGAICERVPDRTSGLPENEPRLCQLIERLTKPGIANLSVAGMPSILRRPSAQARSEERRVGQAGKSGR